VLIERLVDVATTRGFARLGGAVLRTNVAMVAFVRALGFALSDDPDAPDQVIATLPLAPR